MLARLIRAKWPLPVAAALVLVIVVGSAVVAAQDSGNKLVIYNGRSHYGDEKVFEDFESGALAGLGSIRLAPNARAAYWMDDDERRVLRWLSC